MTIRGLTVTTCEKCGHEHDCSKVRRSIARKRARELAARRQQRASEREDRRRAAVLRTEMAHEQNKRRQLAIAFQVHANGGTAKDVARLAFVPVHVAHGLISRACRVVEGEMRDRFDPHDHRYVGDGQRCPNWWCDFRGPNHLHPPTGALYLCQSPTWRDDMICLYARTDPSAIREWLVTCWKCRALMKEAWEIYADDGEPFPEPRTR